MKLTFIAALTLIGTALASPAAQGGGGGGGGGGDKLPPGAPCKKDGSMGICQSEICIQPEDANQGKCK